MKKLKKFLKKITVAPYLHLEVFFFVPMYLVIVSLLVIIALK